MYEKCLKFRVNENECQKWPREQLSASKSLFAGVSFSVELSFSFQQRLNGPISRPNSVDEHLKIK